MKIAASVLLGLTACFLAACQASSPDEPIPAKSAQTTQPHRLPSSVVPRSDQLANFGIDTSTLPTRDAETVQSAWKNFQLILAGKEPACSATYGVADGGSMMYDCESYEIMRVKGLAIKDGVHGYNYGPSLNFRNGNKVERLQFYSDSALAKLEGTP